MIKLIATINDEILNQTKIHYLNDKNILTIFRTEGGNVYYVTKNDGESFNSRRLFDLSFSTDESMIDFMTNILKPEQFLVLKIDVKLR